MKTLWDNEARKELKQRLGRLQHDSHARWGKMNAPRMVAHLCNDTGDWAEGVLGYRHIDHHFKQFGV
jgi:hypothetical protein